MHLYSRHPSFLTCYAAGFLLAYSRLVQAISGTVEVDLVFPQNDTYAPAPVFPIAFTFRNSELAGYLQPQVFYTIYPYRGDDSEHDPAAVGDFDMAWANWTTSDPYIEYGAAVTLDTEGTWLLLWDVEATTCSASGPLNATTGYWSYEMIFTTKKGAKKLDLTASTSGELCSRSLNVTFDITGTRDSGNLFENKKPCAVVAEAAPAPTPCAAKIEASAASSISSYLTFRACVTQTVDPAPWCPPPEKDHGARSLVVPGLAVGGVTFLAMAIGGLGFFMI